MIRCKSCRKFVSTQPMCSDCGREFEPKHEVSQMQVLCPHCQEDFHPGETCNQCGKHIDTLYRDAEIFRTSLGIHQKGNGGDDALALFAVVAGMRSHSAYLQRNPGCAISHLRRSELAGRYLGFWDRLHWFCRDLMPQDARADFLRLQALDVASALSSGVKSPHLRQSHLSVLLIAVCKGSLEVLQRSGGVAPQNMVETCLAPSELRSFKWIMNTQGDFSGFEAAEVSSALEFQSPTLMEPLIAPIPLSAFPSPVASLPPAADTVLSVSDALFAKGESLRSAMMPLDTTVGNLPEFWGKHIHAIEDDARKNVEQGSIPEESANRLLHDTALLQSIVWLNAGCGNEREESENIVEATNSIHQALEHLESAEARYQSALIALRCGPENTDVARGELSLAARHEPDTPAGIQAAFTLQFLDGAGGRQSFIHRASAAMKRLLLGTQGGK